MPGLSLFFLLFGCALMLPRVLAGLWAGKADYLPSAGWFFLMTMPFCIEYPLLHPVTRDTQGFFILLVAFVFFLCDALAPKAGGEAAMPPDSGDTARAWLLAKATGGALVALTLLHFVTTRNIPLLDFLFGSYDLAGASHDRNAFSRDLLFIGPLRYLFSFSPYLLGVPSILLALRAGKYWFAAGIFAWNAFYSIASMAKAPLLVCIIILAVGFMITHPARARRVALIRLAFVACIAALTVGLFISNVLTKDGIVSNLGARIESAKNTPPPTAPVPFANSLGDFMRMDAHDHITPLPPYAFRKIDYVMYRALFTPMEVSARWYEYFHYFPVTDVTFTRLIADARTGQAAHPANAVGVWAYTERFPHKYFHDVYAYASLDADAYARYGLTGVLAALALYAFMRLGLAALSDTQTFTGGVYYSVGLTLLFLLPASASVQAILVAQGFLPVLLIMPCIRLWHARSHARLLP